MAKLSTVLNKLRHVGISVKMDILHETEFYHFFIGSQRYEFIGGSGLSTDQADCLSITFGENGGNDSFYTSITQMIDSCTHSKFPQLHELMYKSSKANIKSIRKEIRSQVKRYRALSNK